MKKIIRPQSLIVGFLISISFAAHAKKVSPIAGLSLDQIADQVLVNAIGTQIQTANKHYVAGEFPTEIQSTLLPVVVGVGKLIGHDQEASAFTTSSVINILSQTYLSHKDQYPSNKGLSLIPGAIRKGVKSFDRYSEGLTYNFYPPHYENGQKMRRPIDMQLFPIWYGFTNIPNDADTTSSVLTALTFDSKINGGRYKVSSATWDEFSRYRDLDRSPQFYNRREKRANTGAFMTWLYDEKNPAMPRFFFASAKRGERIPFNKNDVDCIVNANVIKLAALNNKTNLAGRAESCAMINDMIRKDEHATCGVYYPNTFNLAYAMTLVEKAGDQCLEDQSKQLIIEKILSLQSETGSWTNDRNIWEDKVLSTAFAMHGLLEFGNPRDTRIYSSLFYGAHYLLEQIEYKKGPLLWPSDNFFTATAIARSLIMWRSEAYTNAIISDLLFKLQKTYPHLKADNYLKFRHN